MRASRELEEGKPDACRCAPCSCNRASSAPTPLLVVAIVALNYIPNVFWALELHDRSAGCVVVIFFFHVLLSLMVLAWAHTCCTDPGVPPEWWQRRMAALAAGGQEDLKVCRRSGLYKPARSHFCSVTRRLTLNMDHFCPWVVNTVGFYNRKFFLLFLFYACATIAYSLLTLAAQAPTFFDFASHLTDEGRWLPGPLNTVVLVGAIGLDIILLFILVPFVWFHFRMAYKNHTTIDGERFPQYDLGPHENLASVLGRARWTWLLPCYCDGPDGDGVHWPTNDGGRLSTASALADGAMPASAAHVHPGIARESDRELEPAPSSRVSQGDVVVAKVSSTSASPASSASR